MTISGKASMQRGNTQDRMSGLIWVQIVWNGYRQITMSHENLTKVKIQVQLQLVVTSKVPNILNLDKAWTRNWAWSGSKLFERVISRWQCHVQNTKLKNIGLTPTCHILSSAKHSEPDKSGQNVGLIWVQIIWKGYKQMTMSCKCFLLS